MRLSRDAALEAIRERVAGPLGLDPIQAAWGIHQLVNENMTAAARIHGIERGKDLRAYPLFAFGGAGPVHCWHVARILKVPRLLIPFGAGAVSAFGLLTAPLAFDFVRTSPQRLDQADWTLLNRLYAEMEAEGMAILGASGISRAEVTLKRSAEMRYVGQGHEVPVAVPLGTLSTESLPALNRNFEASYRALYQRTPQGVAIEALSWRLTVSGPEPEMRMTGERAVGAGVPTGRGPAPDDGGGHPGSRHARRFGHHALKTNRPAFFAEANGFVETAVYDRYRLGPGSSFDGPAIVEELESTAVIGPGGRCRVDDQLMLIVELP